MGDTRHELVRASEAGDMDKVLSWTRNPKATIEPQGKQGCAAMVAASAANQVAVMKELLKWGATVNANDGKIALLEAAKAGAAAAVKLLCDGGAELEHKDKDGYSAMALAVKGVHLETVKCLLRAGAPVVHGMQTAGLGNVVQEVKMEKLTDVLREQANITVPAEELMAADQKVWDAQREHMRLLDLVEHQKAGNMLISLEERLAAERAAAAAAQEREKDLTFELSEKRVNLQTIMNQISQVNKDLEALAKSEEELRLEDEKVTAELNVLKGELKEALKLKDQADIKFANMMEARDAALARCKELEECIAEKKQILESTKAELRAAQNELRAWTKNKELALALTAQAHKLLDG